MVLMENSDVGLQVVNATLHSTPAAQRTIKKKEFVMHSCSNKIVQCVPLIDLIEFSN